MKLKFLLSITCALVLLFFACRKDFRSELPPETSDPFLTVAKDHYYTEANKSSNKQTSSDGKTQASTLLKPLWKRGYVSKTHGYEFVEVPALSARKEVKLYNFDKKPLAKEDQLAVVNASFERLVIYRNRKGVFKQVLITYIPDLDYLKKHQFDASSNYINKLEKDFSGYLEHKDLSGHRLFVVRIVNGKVLKKYAIKTSKATLKKGNARTSEECWEECTPIWWRICVIGGDPEIEYCGEWQTDSEHCVIKCIPDIPEPIDPLENPDPCEDPFNYNSCSDPEPEDDPAPKDCAGVENGTAYKVPRCGCIGGTTGVEVCPPCPTSKEDLKKVFPNASDATLENLKNLLNAHSAKFDLDTKEELQHFMAQAGHETGGFRNLSITENLNYSETGLVDTWPNRFSETDPGKKDPDDYAHDQEKIANFVYSNRMGNGDVASGDGYKYRGRGVFQLTGKTNYQAFQDFYNANYTAIDLMSNPDLLSSNQSIAVISALWFYKNNVMDKVTIDANTTVDVITKKINGGKNGIADRKQKFDSAKINVDCND